MKRFCDISLLLMIFIVVLVGLCRGQSQERPSADATNREEVLRAFLQNYEGGRYIAQNPGELRYFDVFYDLNGDGKDEAIVYLVGQCGTGGCPLMVFTPDDDSYKVVTDSPITRPPIRVLNRTSHGWHSLTFQVQGGGIPSPGFEAELRFDGRKYPWNVNEAPVLKEEEPGNILIPNQTFEFPGTNIFGSRPQVTAGQGKALFPPGEQSSPQSPLLPPDEALQKALEIYLMGVHFREAESLANIGYFHSFVDLNGDGKQEVFVYLTGPNWWRSMLVLIPEGHSYMVINHFRGIEPPVRILASTSNGWRILAARAWRRGKLSADEVEFRFDGRIYQQTTTTPDLATSLNKDEAAGITIPPSPSAAPKLLFASSAK
jgi:hypothetical protein